MSGTTRRLASASAVAITLCVACVTPSLAAPEQYDVLLPAGTGCAGFGLGIDITPGNRNIKTFTDDRGNPVRILETGKGNGLVFTNDDTGKSVSLKPNGAVSKTTFNSDGTRTVVATGHNVVILFPTDVPAGPSTKLYVGRLVYQADRFDNFVVKSFSGQTTDICAQLAP